MRFLCRALRTVLPLPWVLRKGLDFPRRGLACGPCGLTVRFASCVPRRHSRTRRQSSRPREGGARAQYTPFCCPTGAHVVSPRQSPTRRFPKCSKPDLSQGSLGGADFRPLPTREPRAAGAPGRLAGRGSRAGAPTQPRGLASRRRGVLPLLSCCRASSSPARPPHHHSDGETEAQSVAVTRPRSPCMRGLEPRCVTSTWAVPGTAQVGRRAARSEPAPLPGQRPSLTTSSFRARSSTSQATPPLRTWPRPSGRPAPRPLPPPIQAGRPLRAAAAAATSTA